jgi:DNA-binding transcriptional MerR regulator
MTQARLTISDVHRRTGIPVTTLRFYERELPDFFTVEKTPGGHRRYTEESVRQFLMVKKMVEADGVRLGHIREKLAAAKDDRPQIRHDVDLLLTVHDAMVRELESLRARVEALELELSRTKKAPSDPAKKKRWF